MIQELADRIEEMIDDVDENTLAKICGVYDDDLMAVPVENFETVHPEVHLAVVETKAEVYQLFA